MRPLADHALFGAFTDGGVWCGMEPVLRLEAELGRRLQRANEWISSWDGSDLY